MMDDKDRDEAKKLCKRLDWMKINGKNDLVQWENVLSYEIARIRAEARDDERRRCAEIIRHVECVNGNETEIRRADAIAAILQGTGPANNHDHNAIVQALQNMIEYAETAIAHEKESNGHPRNKRYHDEMDADLKEAKTVLKELESNG